MGKSGIEPNSSVHETNMLTDALFPLLLFNFYLILFLSFK